MVLRLGLERDLAWGTVRTFAQLFLMGDVLKYLFQLSSLWVILALFAFMVFWAAYTIRSRLTEKSVPIFLPTYLSMLISYTLVTILVTSVIVQVKPWYAPQYFIPLGGMIIGNSMNAITISLERLFAELRSRREEIELGLCLGASYQEAPQQIFRSTVRAGMIPSINALMTVGLVSIPGMMTGQILAGSDPVVAIKYQIVVMLMIAAATAIGAVGLVYLVRQRCCTSAHQLVIR